ncbi:MAG TPA: HAD family hydrolase [Bacteroidota bacterium]|nr:HAD family hydrolase [Bacteroidota bacterium]
MFSGLFLDRDGTINEEVHFLSSPDQLTLIPGSAEAIRQANDLGFKVVVISNQSGVARGMFSEADVRKVNAALISMLEKEHARIDGMYYCPHHPDGPDPAYKKDCDCRKPKIGMLTEAAKKLDIDLKKSILIGDRITDIQTGNNAGTASILVRTGYGAEMLPMLGDYKLKLDYIANNLLDAMQFVKSHLHQNQLSLS